MSIEVFMKKKKEKKQGQGVFSYFTQADSNAECNLVA